MIRWGYWAVVVVIIVSVDLYLVSLMLLTISVRLAHPLVLRTHGESQSMRRRSQAATHYCEMLLLEIEPGRMRYLGR